MTTVILIAVELKIFIGASAIIIACTSQLYENVSVIGVGACKFTE